MAYNDEGFMTSGETEMDEGHSCAGSLDGKNIFCVEGYKTMDEFKQWLDENHHDEE